MQPIAAIPRRNIFVCNKRRLFSADETDIGLLEMFLMSNKEFFFSHGEWKHFYQRSRRYKFIFSIIIRQKSLTLSTLENT